MVIEIWAQKSHLVPQRTGGFKIRHILVQLSKIYQYTSYVVVIEQRAHFDCSEDHSCTCPYISSRDAETSHNKNCRHGCQFDRPLRDVIWWHVRLSGMPKYSICIFCEYKSYYGVASRLECGYSCPGKKIWDERSISISQIRLNPAWDWSNITHSNRPTCGPPFKGIAVPSSAKLLAPVQPSSPATTHTIRLAPTLFVLAITTPGDELYLRLANRFWTAACDSHKIPEPI